MDKVMKQCKKCGVEYPASKQYFYTEKLGRDGLRPTCKFCERERNKIYRAQNHQREIERKRQWRAENPEKTRVYNKQYRIENPEKVRQIQQHCREKNREKYLARNRQWRANNLERERKRARQYAAENYEKHLERGRQWRAKNPERVYELDRQWKKNNPNKSRIIKQRREARKRGLPDKFTELDYDRMMAYWNARCAVCGREANDGLIIVPDHWIALSDARLDNPGTVPENIVPLCHSLKAGMRGCNNIKWNLDAKDWIVKEFGAVRGLEIQERIEIYFAWVYSEKKKG